MEIDLEVVGRHAMLFDDDATLEFVNSKEALIEWNSLFIDRFDVRNLIDVAPASFRHLPTAYYGALPDDDSHLFADLDTERFADLFAVNDDDNGDDVQLDEKGAMDAGGYNCVPFSYGNFADSTAQKSSGIDVNASSFHPSFPVPENLLQNLPPSEKVHQIIARTAMFVGQHGGQSEIVLRVKQGDNPTFGFLMPHHHLHPYFRYLVDHPEVLKTDNDSKSQGEKSNDVQATGALSLLGSIYGSGEDEDVEAKVEIKSEQTVSGGTASASDVPKSDKSEQNLSAGDGAQKDETVSVHSQTSKVKVSAPSIKSITSIKPGRATSIKSYGSISSSTGSSMEKPKASSLFPLAHAEKSLVDPPSEMKKLVDRIVEIILKNGKHFETVLIEQDKKHGKFPFLLPSNQYHPYYIRALKKAQESRISGKTFGSGKEGSSWQEIEKDAGHQMKETECASLDGSDDLDLDYDKKDKFKMIIPKTKKDPQEQPPKESQQQSRFTVDATAAAAILQAATRGFRNPNWKIFSNKTSHDSSIEGGPSSNSALKENGESSHTARGDKDIAKIAAGEADTDPELMRQQKLKAERLRRAKMFAAMIKSGAAPLGTEPPRSSSLEPPGSGCGPGNSGLADKNVVEEVKGREGSYPLMESNDENEQKLNKRRHYRSRKHDDGQGEEEIKENEEDTGEDDDEKSRSTKRHKSRHSSRRHRDRSKDRHKHRRRHSSSKSKESRHRHKRDSSSEDDDDRHHRQKSDSSLEGERKHYKRRHKHENSSEEESKHVKKRHKESSRKHRHRERSGKNDRSHTEEGELEEGEIGTRSSDQSLSAIGEDASREASVDASKSSLREKRSSLPPTEPTEVPDELRAKIRAMLLATM